MFNDAQHRGRLLRGFLAVGAGNYGALVLSLILSVVLTRRLGVEGYGRFSLLLMASQIAMLVAANWTYVALLRFGAQEYSSSGTVAKTFWARTAIVGPLAVLSVVGAGLGREHLAGYLAIPQWGLILVIGHFVLFYVMTSLGAVFQARQELARYGTLILADKALVLGLVLAAALAVGLTPLGVLAVYAASCLIVSLAGLLALGRRSLLPVRVESATVRSLLRFSLPLTLSIWAGIFGTNWVDYVIIKGSLSVSDVGLYSLAGQLSGVVQQLTIIFTTMLLPQLSVMVLNGDQAGIRSYLRRMLPYWLLGTSVLFCLVVLGADPLVPLIFGDPFRGAVVPFAILMIATSALALFNAFDPLLNAYGATWALMKVTAVSVAVKVALTLWLTPLLGLAGAAIGTVGAYLASALLVMALIRRQTGTSVAPMVLMMAPVLAVCAARLWLVGPMFYLVGLAGATFSVLALVRAFRLFQVEDRGLMKELWATVVIGSRKVSLDPIGPRQG